MIAIDLYKTIDKLGNFMTFAGIADLHLLFDTEDEQAYQPLDYNAFQYFKHCFAELRAFKNYYGEIITYTGGDLSELERSTVRKVNRQHHKNDTRAMDTIHKGIIRKSMIPKIQQFTKGTRFIGGVAGNHLIEFSDQSKGNNSEEYIINLLGGKYCGEGKMLVNLHINYGPQRAIKKILITHGAKAGTKQAIIRELQDMYFQYGVIDLVVKCHAHDPMAHFHCKYNLPDKVGQKIKKQETLVMCLGSTRDGEKMGYDDYSERGNYQPHASRYPMAIFHAYKPQANDSGLDIKIRPLIM